MIKQFIFSLLTPRIFAQFQPNVPVDNRTLAELYSAAKQEYHSTGKEPLQVFFGGDAGLQGNGVRTAWKKAFPDIPLNLTVDLSKYHDSRINRAYYYENKSIADVAVLQVLNDFPDWKQQSRLLYYKPPTFNDILEGSKDPDGAFLPVFIISFGPFYFDKTKCPQSTIPDSYASLIDPQWKGKLTFTYPNDDDAVAYLFSVITSRYGFDWFEALAANDVKWVRGTGTPVLEFLADHKNSSSKRCLTITQFGLFDPKQTDFIAIQNPSAPEQTISWTQTAAILANTPHPDMAKLFVAWLTSSEFQSAFAGPGQPIGSRTSISGATILSSLNEKLNVSPYGQNITQITGFPVFETNRALVEAWKNQYESIIGTPQGPGPIQIYPNPPCCA